MSSQQQARLATSDRPVVEHPERVWFRDYHEHIRIQREEAANGS